jgi:hypothetical protein
MQGVVGGGTTVVITVAPVASDSGAELEAIEGEPALGKGLGCRQSGRAGSDHACLGHEEVSLWRVEHM